MTLNHGSAIPFVRTGWEDEATELGVFDLIIGNDLLYGERSMDVSCPALSSNMPPPTAR